MAITGSQKAYKYALSGVMRSGTSRSGYVSAQTFIAADGVSIGRKVALDSLVITDELDETPNRCTFRLINGVVNPGQEILITQGSTRGARLFAGHVVDVRYHYWQKPVNLRMDVACVDYTWQFGFVKVTKRYTNQSASAIAQDLVSTYAAVNGFTARNVAPNLPVLPEITYTNEDLTDAMTRLARRIGAYWYVDYQRDVHLFFDEVGNGAPLDLTPTHPSLADVVKETDRTQTLTRVYVEGRGSSLLGDVSLGDTMIPLDAVDMFSPVESDVFLKASFQGADGGAQHLTYTGVVPGRGGTVVGPGIGPAAALTLTRAVGTGVTAGVHAYGVTFVTATGESLVSPTASITAGGQVVNPTVSPTGWTPPSNWFGDLLKNGYYQIKYAYATDNAWPPAEVTLASPPSPVIQANTNTGATSTQGAINTSIPCSSDPTVKYVIVYRTVAGGPTFYRCTRAVNVPGTVLPPGNGSSPSDATIVTMGTEPVANTTPTSGAVALSAIPVGVPATVGGVSPVTQRKVYRTAAGASQLKLLTTLANNTATTYTDTTADASLGANVPVNDTSGLTQPDGQVLAHANVIPVAGSAPFEPTGGWAIIGNGEQVIRYTSSILIPGYLTGIPIDGLGSITATIVYNSTITAAPMLTGIPTSGPRGITGRALTKGDEMYLVVQVDDTARQAQFDDMGGNGIREEWEQDRRLSIAEARMRGTALLQLRELDQQRVTYTCRDTRTASGKTIAINLPTMIIGQLKIQRVTISNFRPYPTQLPTYTVEASSSRYSFEDLLRSAKTKE